VKQVEGKLMLEKKKFEKMVDAGLVKGRGKVSLKK